MQATTGPVTVAEVLEHTPWLFQDYFRHRLTAKPGLEYCYWYEGTFGSYSLPLGAKAVLSMGLVPASRPARVLTLIDAYMGPDKRLVLADLKGRRPKGVVFEPCPDAPEKTLVREFDEYGFKAQTVAPNLITAVERYHTYVRDGRDLMDAVLRFHAAHH